MPYAMSPGPSILHQYVSGRLLWVFHKAITKGGQHYQISLPINWKIDDKSVVQPDLLVLYKPVDSGEYLESTPALVVEVLSPATAFKDRHEKFELYEQSGVRYYLIVDPSINKIEVYQLIDGQYQPAAVTPSQFSFTLEEGCELAVDFAKTWD